MPSATGLLQPLIHAESPVVIHFKVTCVIGMVYMGCVGVGARMVCVCVLLLDPQLHTYTHQQLCSGNV